MLIRDTYKRYFLRHRSLKKDRKFTCKKNKNKLNLIEYNAYLK